MSSTVQNALKSPTSVVSSSSIPSVCACGFLGHDARPSEPPPPRDPAPFRSAQQGLNHRLAVLREQVAQLTLKRERYDEVTTKGERDATDLKALLEGMESRTKVSRVVSVDPPTKYSGRTLHHDGAAGGSRRKGRCTEPFRGH